MVLYFVGGVCTIIEIKVKGQGNFLTSSYLTG